MGFRVLTMFSVKFGIRRYIKGMGHIVCPKEMNHFKNEPSQSESDA